MYIKNVYQTPFYCKYQYTTLKKLNTKHGYKYIAFLFINISYMIIFKTKLLCYAFRVQLN